jgi:hypothetical protein
MQDDFGNEVPHPTLSQVWRRMDTLEQQLNENTESTKRIEQNTSLMLEMFDAFKKAFKVLEWIGNLAKPISAIVGLCIVVITLIKTIKIGVTPK